MTPVNLLVIEDDAVSLKLLEVYLKNDRHNIIVARDGQEASDVLDQYPDDYFQCIISDIMMPNKTGIELLDEVKQHPTRKRIPFILQTSASSDREIQQGLNKGAFYYLIKPITKDTLNSVVNAALKDYQNHREAISSIAGVNAAFPLITKGQFKFKTIEEAKHLSNFLALLTTDPEIIGIGYFELMINAVEHGNLGITYDEKTELINESELKNEIKHRLTQEAFKDKYVTVDVNIQDQQLKVSILDMGQGFDFEDYMEFSIDRAMDNHGRGIMMANKLSFDALMYSEGGRCATCTTSKIKLSEPGQTVR